MTRILILAIVSLSCVAPAALADAPVAMYIFPAGGQRGTNVAFRVGGLYLHDECRFELTGAGIAAPAKINATETIWFEGPVIPLPDSQQAEDYPRDLAGTMTIAADAAPGIRTWRLWTDQGAAPSRSFIVGDLPEIVEHEIDGDPIPVRVELPVTINGRIFPREDVDLWTFEAKSGQTITCAALAARLGSPFDARLEVRDSRGMRLAESAESSPPGIDALVRFTAPADGTYSVRIHDQKFGGLQHYVYRLTLTAGPFADHVFPLGGRRGATTKFEISGSNLPEGASEISLPAEGTRLPLAASGLPGTSGRSLSLELDDLPERIEQEPNETAGDVPLFEAPVIVNGRISQPGDVDVFGIRGTKEAVLEFDIRAARFGSPLDSVLVLVDKNGKELARSDDANLSDSFLKFTFPEDGTYFVRVEERVASRGSLSHAYRLRIAPPAAPGFALQLPTDAVTVNRGGEAKLKIKVERSGSFAEPIQLEFEGLPPGIAVPNAVIPGNATEFDLTLKAEPTATIGARAAKFRGRATIAGQPAV
ncbi:MAG: PPC domain-containing protein, partial [Planctomycetia bacterium]|nr:PPC domain-containing protein [Planctomycetia bacterium]